MDYTGLLSGYRANRRLSAEEQRSKLNVKEKKDLKLLDQICTVNANSTFLESVDKWYGYKGFITLFTLPILIGMLFGIVNTIYTLFYSKWDTIYKNNVSGAIILSIVVLVVGGGVAFGAAFLFLKESFAYTHYPIRLNRKNRMVYVFRTNGTVLSVPWDEVHFAIEYEGSRLGNIKGHVLDKDGKTVLETFAFCAVSTSREILLGHWEFLRRYMEEGPQAVFDVIRYCMPVDGRYESFKAGMERTFANDYGLFPGSGLILWPLNYLTSLGRFFAMRTSKIPVWPPEVEEACKVDPSDPYIKDSRINPPDLR